MKEYLFYIEGLDQEVWQEGISRSAAHTALWESLQPDECERVVQMDCIDEREKSSC